MTWELSLVIACPKHFIDLLDECPHCKQPLRWDRPGLTTCRCGHDITVAPTKRCSVEAADFAARMAATVTPEVPHAGNFGLLPAFMNGLSAPVQCAIVHAYGALERRTQTPRPSDVTKRRPRSYWEPVLQRAVDRLRRIEEGEKVLGQVNDPILLAQARLESRLDQRRLCLQLVTDEGAEIAATQRQGKLSLEAS